MKECEVKGIDQVMDVVMSSSTVVGFPQVGPNTQEKVKCDRISS